MGLEKTSKSMAEYRDMLIKEGLLTSDNSEEASFDVKVEYVSYNSQKLKANTLFIVKGANFKAEYLNAALENGAIGYIAEKDMGMDKSVPCIIVQNLRRAISKVSAMYFDRSWNEGLNIIGLTGTKGKSTTAFMIKSILDTYCGREIGFSSGIFTYDGETKEKSRKLTTPETIELHTILDNCVKNETKYLTMEVSSQGLKYDRVCDLHYSYSAFLNISEDHISNAEHSDMEDYFTSKLKIFEMSDNTVINCDMDENYYPRVESEAYKYCKNVKKFGFKENADIRGLEVSEIAGKLNLKALIMGTEEEFSINIGGKYNAYNALCAIAITSSLGVPIEYIKKGLDTVVVPGRMEHYKLANDVDVIVDCAHNKMSYEALFNYAREAYPGKEIGFLFGCVGDKAFNRRKEAAAIADENADFIMITERDPGKEPVSKICSEIYENIDNKEKAEIETDRDTAVKKILDMASQKGNSVVLLCGCGSDAYVKRGTSLVEFNTDGERVQEYIREHEQF